MSSLKIKCEVNVYSKIEDLEKENLSQERYYPKTGLNTNAVQEYVWENMHM